MGDPTPGEEPADGDEREEATWRARAERGERWALAWGRRGLRAERLDAEVAEVDEAAAEPAGEAAPEGGDQPG